MHFKETHSPWLDYKLLVSIVNVIKNNFCVADDAEITLEANPGTVTREWLDTAVSVGVNRISFGMQACQDHLLRILGRIHHFQDVCRSVQLARESGIENINLDLIFGLPGQRMKDWMESLEAALSLHPEHISAYGLIPEEGTPLFEDLKNGGLSLPDPEDERQMYWNAVRILREYGYDQYEISNFARKGYECRHNIGYWTQIPYIGLGVSAASMVHLRTGTGGMTCIRRVNPSSQEAYIRLTETDYSGVSVEKIAPHESRFETLMLGLRMNDGISEEGFLRLHGVPVDKYYGSRLNDMERKGLMIHKNGRWRMTERGFDIQNSILVELMD